DGSVVIAETQQIAEQAAGDAAKSSLSGNSDYRNDVKAVGGDGGVVTAWADLAGAARLVPPEATGNGNLDQRAGTPPAASLRFTDTVADVTLKVFGNAQAPRSGPVGDRVGRLPDDTAVAVGISGGDQIVRQAYTALEKAGLTEELNAALSEYELQLPDDL